MVTCTTADETTSRALATAARTSLSSWVLSLIRKEIENDRTNASNKTA